MAGAAILLLCLLFSSGSAHSESEADRSGASVAVSVLSYNIHGLPSWIAGDHPATRLRFIGDLVNRYDVVLLQEDFAYHGPLIEHSIHPIVLQGNGTSPLMKWLGAPFCGSCGSGLAILARFPPDRLLAMDREPFHVCAGWLWSGNDCWASKGFMRARLRLGDGLKVDFYDTHLDAGTASADRETRKRQLDLLRQHIQVSSRGAAVVIGGDLNLSPQSADDQRILRQFTEELGLGRGYAPSADAEAPGGVDYILYRSGRQVALKLSGAGIAREFVEDGRTLSDHQAIWTRFKVLRR